MQATAFGELRISQDMTAIDIRLVSYNDTTWPTFNRLLRFNSKKVGKVSVLSLTQLAGKIHSTYIPGIGSCLPLGVLNGPLTTGIPKRYLASPPRNAWELGALPETNISFTPENWMVGRRGPFLLGAFRPIFRGELLVVGRVVPLKLIHCHTSSGHPNDCTPQE